MYQVFDSFLRKPTWSSHHPSDMINFDTALAEVIGNPDFDPETMGNYFTQHGANDIWGGANRDSKVKVYVDRARAKLRRQSK